MIGPEWSVCESNTIDRKIWFVGAVGFEPTYPMEWAVKDLHLRSLMATDLQSALVDYLSNCPKLFLFSRSDTDRTCVGFIPNEVPEPLGYAPILFMRPNVILFCILIALLFNVQTSPLSIPQTYNKSCSCE